MPRREAVVPPRLDVQQLVERVAVGAARSPPPGRSRTGRPARLNASATGKRMPVAMISRVRKSGETRRIVPRSSFRS